MNRISRPSCRHRKSYSPYFKFIYKVFRKQNLKVDMTDKPFELVILNQYYIPDVASTGHLLSELANESSRRGVSVRVISSFPSYGPPESWKPCQANEVGKNISIRRLRTTRSSRSSQTSGASESSSPSWSPMEEFLIRVRSAKICS